MTCTDTVVRHLQPPLRQKPKQSKISVYIQVKSMLLCISHLFSFVPPPPLHSLPYRLLLPALDRWNQPVLPDYTVHPPRPTVEKGQTLMNRPFCICIVLSFLLCCQDWWMARLTRWTSQPCISVCPWAPQIFYFHHAGDPRTTASNPIFVLCFYSFTAGLITGYAFSCYPWNSIVSNLQSRQSLVDFTKS